MYSFPYKDKDTFTKEYFIHKRDSVMKKISEAIGHEFSMNDEEIISNNFPIIMVSDFVACHLHFADQRARLQDSEEDELLRQYDSLAKIIAYPQTWLVYWLAMQSLMNSTIKFTARKRIDRFQAYE